MIKEMSQHAEGYLTTGIFAHKRPEKNAVSLLHTSEHKTAFVLDHVVTKYGEKNKGSCGLG